MFCYLKRKKKIFKRFLGFDMACRIRKELVYDNNYLICALAINEHSR